MTQPTTLPDDARKIAEALKAIAECETSDIPDADFQRRTRYDLQEIARATISSAESLPGKIEALERERDEAKSIACEFRPEADRIVQNYNKLNELAVSVNSLLNKKLTETESQLIVMTNEAERLLIGWNKAKAQLAERDATARAEGIKEAAAWAALKAAHYARQPHDPLGNEERFNDIARSILKLLDPKEPNVDKWS